MNTLVQAGTARDGRSYAELVDACVDPETTWEVLRDVPGVADVKLQLFTFRDGGPTFDQPTIGIGDYDLFPCRFVRGIATAFLYAHEGLTVELNDWWRVRVVATQ